MSSYGLAAIATMTVALWTAAAFADDHPEAPRRLGVRECVAEALERNLDVKNATAEIAVTEAERERTRGHFGPKLRADASVTQYNSAYAVMGFPVHDALTWNFTASVSQPITGLLVLYDAYKVSDLGLDVAMIRREATRRDTAALVTEAYYRLLQAERLSEVAVASVEQLKAHLRQAQSFHDNGLVSKDDVLRAQLAVANAQQRLIQSRARVTIGRSRLAVLMGLPPDAAIDAQPLANDEAPAPEAISMESAELSGERNRIELTEIDRRITQADHEVRAAWLRLAPQVSGVAAYVHNVGSLFSPLDSGYVGGVASWDLWDWGVTTSGISSAKARREQTRVARAKVDEQVRLEVREAFVGVASAREATAVAEASTAAAEENFRLVHKRYDASSATSFDVVDAEAVLTQARGQRQTALYDLLIARGALRRAMGHTPDQISEP